MAEGGSDGSLRFDTKIDTSGFDGGISTLTKAVDRLSAVIDKLSNNIMQHFTSAGMAAESVSKEVDSIGDAAAGSETKVKSLQEQMDAISVHNMEDTSVSEEKVPLASAPVSPASLNYDPKAMAAVFGEAAAEIHNYSDAVNRFGYQAGMEMNAMEREVSEAEREISEASTESIRLQEIGDNAQVSNQKLIELTQRLEELKARQKELSAAGVTTGYAEYDENHAEITRITARINEYKKSIAEAASQTSFFSKAATSAFSIAAKAVNNFVKPIGSKLANGIKQTVSNLKSMGKTSNGVSKSILKLSNMFKLMLIRMAMRAAIQGVREGMQNLVRYSDSANQSMSNLMSGITYLKNSFAAAFAPILSIVAPILNTLINLLATAIGYINQFFAALGGGKTFIRAKKVNQDYAKSIGAAGGAAKKAGKDAKKALAPFDELNQLQGNDASGGAGGGSGGAGAGDMFETVGIAENISDFANQLKDMFEKGDWSGIGKLIGDKINDAVQSFTDFISWERVGAKITAFVTAFTTLFNSLVSTINWYAIGMMMGSGINTLAYTLYLLLTQIDWFMLGNALSQSLIGMIQTVDWSAVGATIGAFFQAQISGLLGFIIGTDWGAIGAALATCIMGITGQIEWAQLGFLLASGLNGAFAFLLQFASTFDWIEFGNQIATSLSTLFQTFDWGQAGESLSTFIIGLLDFLITVVQETDWAAFVQGIVDCIEGIDWIGLAGRILELLSSALAVAFNALAQLIGTLIIDGVTAAKDYFAGKIEECGGNVAEGILKGIMDAWSGIHAWIYDHVFAPFINGVLKAFGIQGASSSELKQFGQYLWSGFTDGIKKFFTNPGSFIKSYITDPFVNGIKNLLGIHSPSTVLDTIGGNTVDGFNSGVEKGQASSQGIIQSWAKGVASWFSEKLGISSKESKESKEWADSIMSGYNNTVSHNYTKSQSIMEKWADSVKQWFVGSGTSKGVNEATWNQFADVVIKAFTSGIQSGNSGTKSPVESWAKSVKDGFWGASYSGGTNGMYQEFYNMAKLVNQGFAAGISAFSHMAKNAVQKWGSEVIASAKTELDIHSPSRVAYSIAQYFIKGFNNGVLAMLGSSVSTAEKWLDRVTGIFDGIEIEIPLGINIPNPSAYLPRMASGAVVPQRAGIFEPTRRHDGGNEQDGQVLSKLQELINSLKPQGGGSDRDIHLTVNLDGKVVFNDVVKRTLEERNRTGKNPLLV